MEMLRICNTDKQTIHQLEECIRNLLRQTRQIGYEQDNAREHQRNNSTLSEIY